MDINISDSKKVNLGKEAVQTVYRHYKDNILPIAVILVCILIFFFVVIPAFKQFMHTQEQLKIEMQKLDILKNNYNFLLSLDDSQTEKDYNLMSRVLPSNKDFVRIMNAISTASQKTGVAVGDFDFSLGNLDKTIDQTLFPSIKINVNLSGSVQSIAKFVTELYKTAPISEVTTINASGTFATLEIKFYYKPFPPLNISGESPIVPYSQQSLSLINQVAAWNNINEDFLFPFLPIASGSSEQNFSSSSSAGQNPSPF